MQNTRFHFKFIAGLGVLLAVLGLLSWTFMLGREELQKERERELPVKVPARVSRSKTGKVVVTLDAETQERLDIRVASLPISSADLGQIPHDAVVRFDGRAWVYLKTGPEEFERNEVSVNLNREGRALTSFVSRESAKTIVIQGGGILLSEEMKSLIQIGDEAESK